MSACTQLGAEATAAAVWVVVMMVMVGVARVAVEKALGAVVKVAVVMATEEKEVVMRVAVRAVGTWVELKAAEAKGGCREVELREVVEMARAGEVTVAVVRVVANVAEGKEAEAKARVAEAKARVDVAMGMVAVA